MSDQEVHDFLEHYGVKGMKWGVRKGKSETGLARRDSHKIQKNKRQAELHKSVRDRNAGKVLNALSAPDKVIMGEERFKKFHNTAIKNLEAQNSRIKAGEKTVRDRIDVNLNVSIATLVERKKN